MKKEKTINAYGTHLPVIEKIFKIEKIETVLEFGPGSFSTEFFIENCKKLISIEQQSLGFFDVMSKRLEKVKNVDLLYLSGALKGVEYLKKLKDNVDLVFIDGDQNSRGLCVNEGFKKADIIVAHDTDSISYPWECIKMPKGWHRLDCKEMKPWTTVWTKNEKLINKLKTQED